MSGQPTAIFLKYCEPMPASSLSRDLCKHNLADQVLKTTGSLRLAAFGYSMLPTLWPGDILTIRAVTLGEVKTGDVVLFSREARFFIHRVLRIVQPGQEARLLTRGDAMPGADAPVRAEEFLGKVVSVQRGSNQRPVACGSVARRCLGLLLAYSTRLRSLALRWHARRSPVNESATDLPFDQALVK